MRQVWGAYRERSEVLKAEEKDARKKGNRETDKEVISGGAEFEDGGNE